MQSNELENQYQRVLGQMGFVVNPCMEHSKHTKESRVICSDPRLVDVTRVWTNMVDSVFKYVCLSVSWVLLLV